MWVTFNHANALNTGKTRKKGALKNITRAVGVLCWLDLTNLSCRVLPRRYDGMGG